MKRICLLLITVVCTSICTCAQSVAGDWQGTLNIGSGLRTILRIESSTDGSWKGTFFSIDQTSRGITIPKLDFQNSDIKFSIPDINGSYEGKLSSDGNSINGTWHQGQSWPLNFQRATAETAWKTDPTPHQIHLVEVEPGVKIEALDWGGTGRPLILLAGLGNIAHDFDKFALKLTGSYHVYGITRRGFGASSAPAPDGSNYTADRLGDDILSVMAALHIDKPVLVGHSIAGEELSSIGTRFPNKIAGLIYLDAGYSYAYYDDHAPTGDPATDASELRRQMDKLFQPTSMGEHKAIVKQVLETTLPRFQRDLQDIQKQLASVPDNTPAPPNAQEFKISAAIQRGEQAYRGVKCPVLAIFAVPHSFGPNAPKDQSIIAERNARDLTQVEAFQAGNPQAKVVRLPNADHFVFYSNEADVLREMNAFIAALPAS
ncbi:alpha/beta fold hydrolase [Occallatibacter savannae]|uniref:alpha/beta fold hydrolase n=1 Tax=Occallatibacter savannae TaxID=1002691 RepID=UPI000D695D21|nr:alpha/beta hydrolase [Occallatibacter savannae]